MDPAFSSPRQAGAFVLLLLLILLLPVLVGQALLPTREQMYSSVGRGTIDFPYLHQQIFEEKGDIDIGILGSSRLGCALDSSYLQEKLSEKLGRKAVVRSLTWTWNGYDALYFIAQDLLQHRKVRLMIIGDLSYDLSPGVGNMAHHQTSYWFRYADNAGTLDGLPMQSQASFYASAILGMPRNLLGLFRANLPAIPEAANHVYWAHSPTDYMPDTSVGPADVRLYSVATRAGFHFSDAPAVPMQLDFIRKIGELARENQVQLVFLDVPDFFDRKQDLIEESANWPEAFQGNLPMLGIAPTTLFRGMSDDDVGKLYFNPTHFNQNGQKYFTQIMTPNLVQVYEDQIKP